MKSFQIRVHSTKKRGRARHARSLLAAIIVCSMFGPASGATNAGDRSARPQIVAMSTKLTSSYRGVAQEQVIWNFGGPSDGELPLASLIADSSGAMYGTTEFGGNSTSGRGVVYKLTPAGSGYTETVLYNFQGSPNDGSTPLAGLVADNSGALYGTTDIGGSCNCGTVFKLSPAGSGYTESILYNFQSRTGGANPAASVVADGTGTLYGTTTSGGVYGYGTAFKLTATKSGYTETVLHQFQKVEGPPTSGLVANRAGTLFGEGSLASNTIPAGIVYSLTPTKSGYRYAELYRFRNKHDGNDPTGGLLLDGTGALYGTALFGGTKGCNCGTVFKLTPTGLGYKETTLHIFLGRSGKDGASPNSGVIADGTGVLYGTTTNGGELNYGTLFKLTATRSGYTESILYSFPDPPGGVHPYAGLLLDQAGSLYGTTYRGGTGSSGIVFKITQ
jgi:uncharacterized repeat protein (TIGR03803 family)